MHNMEDVSAWIQPLIFLFVWGNKENVTRDILYQYWSMLSWDMLLMWWRENVVTYAFETSWRVTTNILRETSWWFKWSRVGSYGVSSFGDLFVSVAFVLVCTSVIVCVDTLSEGWRVTELLCCVIGYGCSWYWVEPVNNYFLNRCELFLC